MSILPLYRLAYANLTVQRFELHIRMKLLYILGTLNMDQIKGGFKHKRSYVACNVFIKKIFHPPHMATYNFFIPNSTQVSISYTFSWVRGDVSVYVGLGLYPSISFMFNMHYYKTSNKTRLNRLYNPVFNRDLKQARHMTKM